MTAVVPKWSDGERLAKARKHAGLTQAQMAEKLGVSAGAVAQWERETAQPRNMRARLNEWAFITGVSYDWLMTGVDLGGATSSWGDMALDLLEEQAA